MCLNKETGKEKRASYRSLDWPKGEDFPYDDERWEKAYNTVPHKTCTEGKVSEVTIADADDVTKGVDPEYCGRFWSFLFHSFSLSFLQIKPIIC